MKKIYIIIAFFALSIQFANAQFSLDGEFRPRSEFRNGFGNLIPDNTDAGFGVSTRVRLNAGFKTEDYNLYVSFQDVYAWGENRQLLPEDANNSFAVFEAWVDYKINANWSTKLGRQTIDYDDQRIMGSVDWTQQARNHDAGLLRYKKEKLMFDLGFAFNQDKSDASGFSSVGTEYTTQGFFSYKAMQYGYVKKEWETFSASFLALNTTFQDLVAGVSAGTTSSLVTMGSHLNYSKDKIGVEGNVFYQTGERQNEIITNAYLASFDFSYKATAKVKLGFGAEIISGVTDNSAAFFPLYGTNHKFNGLMDYFYVGNHANSIGLVDLHANAKFSFSEKSNLSINFLNFSGAEALPSGEKSLGNEIDLVFATKLKGAGLAIGYSHLFANDGMYELKGTTKEASASLQNWAWVMLTIKPKFLN